VAVFVEQVPLFAEQGPPFTEKEPLDEKKRLLFEVPLFPYIIYNYLIIN
jgi:hypothetical protein